MRRSGVHSERTPGTRRRVEVTGYARDERSEREVAISMRRLTLLWVLGGLVTGAGMPIAAQVTEKAPDSVLVLGLVLDGSSEDGVTGALVRFQETQTQVRTNERGEFHLPAFPTGTHTVAANHWGYLPHEMTVRVEENVVLVLRLQPNPLLLDAIEVTVDRSSVTDRINRRARTIGRSYRSLDRGRLLLSSASNPMEALQDRYGIRWLPCPGDEPGERNCLAGRNRPERPMVYLDDMRLPGGLGVLEYYLPEQFERVEYFHPPVNQLRVYTPHYLDWLTQTGHSLPPICVGCQIPLSGPTLLVAIGRAFPTCQPASSMAGSPARMARPPLPTPVVRSKRCAVKGNPNALRGGEGKVGGGFCRASSGTMPPGASGASIPGRHSPGGCCRSGSSCPPRPG